MNIFHLEIDPNINKTRKNLMEKLINFVYEYQHTIIRGQGGIGKTISSVKAFVKNKFKALLAVQTNKAVLEQSETLRGQKLKVQSILGAEYKHSKHEKYPIRVKMSSFATPWSGERMPDAQNIVKQLMSAYPELTESDAWNVVNECKADVPDWDNHDVVVITQARIQSLRVKQFKDNWNDHNYIHPDCVIIVDDPLDVFVKTDLVMTAEVKKWLDKEYAGKTRLERGINGEKLNVKAGNHFATQLFLEKPKTEMLHHGINNKFVWLCTEQSTTELLDAMFDSNIVIHAKEPKNEDSGVVTIIKSDMTAGAHQVLIPLFTMRIAKHQNKWREVNKPMFVGDSLGQPNNLTNIKGSNDFTSKSIIGKISQRSYIEVMEVGEQIGSSDIRRIKSMLMAERMDQLAYRNRGYRYSTTTKRSVKNSESIQIVSNFFAKDIAELSEHNIKFIDMKDVKEGGFFPEEMDTESLMVWYMANWQRYLTNSIGDNRGRSIEQLKTEIRDLLWNTNSFSVRLVAGYLVELFEELKVDADVLLPKLKESRLKYLNEMILMVEALPSQIASAEKYEEAASTS